jgi:hypothetical protein
MPFFAEFNATAYAESAASAGARYAIITMMQGTKYMLAPNTAYDSFSGYAPGEACATRDLVLDLYTALAPRGIRLMLYWTGDGPHMDQQASTGLGWPEAPVSRSNVPVLFTERWGAVLQVCECWWLDEPRHWHAGPTLVTSPFHTNETGIRREIR